MVPPLLTKVTKLQKKILKLAYQRLLEKDDLSLGEILIVGFGCKPETIGRKEVRDLSLDEVLEVCRLEAYEDFHFSDNAQHDTYRLAQESVSKAVPEWLKKRGTDYRKKG